MSMPGQIPGKATYHEFHAGLLHVLLFWGTTWVKALSTMPLETAVGALIHLDHQIKVVTRRM